MSVNSMECQNTYEKNKDGLQSKGNDYPVQLCTLYLLHLQRLQKNGSIESFKIGAEVKNAGKFDDVTVHIEKEYETNYFFFQLKHKEHEVELLTIKHLTSSKDFRLDKYFLSFLQIRNSDEYKKGNIKNLIIFTPMSVNSELESFLERIEFDDILRLKKSGSMFYKLANFETVKKWIIEAINSEKKCDRNNKNQNIEKNSINIAEIKEFCEKFVLAVCQPRYEEMKLLLQEEFDNYDKSIKCNDWLEEIKAWIIRRSEKESYLTYQEFKKYHMKLVKPDNKKLKKFLDEIIYSEENSSFDHELTNHFEKSDLVIKEYFISRSEKAAFLKKLIIILQKLEEEYVYTDQKHFYPDDNIFWSTFNRVLIVDCGTCLTHRSSIFFENNCRKVVVILEDELDINIKRKFGQIILSLPDNYKQEDSVEYYNNEKQYIKSKSQNKVLISQQKIEINNIFKDIQVIKKYKGDMKSLVRNQQYRQFLSLHSYESERFVAFMNTPGSGKTVYLKMLEMKYRKNKHFQEYSVIHITCREFKSQVGIHQNDTFKEILIKIMRKWNLSNISKIILILDAFDEAVDDDKQMILKLLHKSRHWSILKKCFLTSRKGLEYEELIEKVFGRRYWQLVELSEKNQKDFLVNFFQKETPNISENIDNMAESILHDVKTSPLSVLIKEPLHLKLLADFYVENKSINILNNGKLKGVGWFLESVINLKLNHWIQKKMGATEKNNYFDNAMKDYKQRIIEDLENVAWEIIVEENAVLKETNCPLVLTGLIYQLANNEIVFIHRTIAEYFAAQAIINRPENLDGIKICSIFVPVILNLCTRFLSEKLSMLQEFLYFQISKLPEQKTRRIAKCIQKKIELKKFDINSACLGNRLNIKFFAFIYNSLDDIQKENFNFCCDFETIKVISAFDIPEYLDILLKRNNNTFGSEIYSELMSNSIVRNQPETLKVLLQHKVHDCREESTYRKGNVCLLHWALICGSDSCILVITQHMKSILNKTNYQIWSENVELPSYIIPTIKRDFNKIEKLYKQGHDINFYSTTWGTILHFIAASKNFEVAKFIMKFETIQLDIANSKGFTAMHFSSIAGCSKIVKMLLENKANYKVTDFQGRTPFYYAAFGLQIECMKLLLKIDKFETEIVEDSSKCTPLHWAARKNPDIVKLLLENGANVNHKCSDGRTPLMMSIVGQNFDCFKIILAAQGCQVNEFDNKGFSALMLAIVWGNVEVIELLLKNAASPNLKNYNGNTFFDLLHYSTIFPYNATSTEMCSYLLSSEYITIPLQYVDKLKDIVEKGMKLPNKKEKYVAYSISTDFSQNF